MEHGAGFYRTASARREGRGSWRGHGTEMARLRGCGPSRALPGDSKPGARGGRRWATDRAGCVVRGVVLRVPVVRLARMQGSPTVGPTVLLRPLFKLECQVPMRQPRPPEPMSSCSGYCRDCQRLHRLPEGNARAYARELMREFEAIGRLDYRVLEDAADPRLSFGHLFPGERGHMFGVLECRDEGGDTVVLRAFSSLREGIREIDGWVPPILSVRTFEDVVFPGDQEIKALSRRMESLDPESSAAMELAAQRMQLSRTLAKRIQGGYRFHNIRGESRSLKEAFSLPSGIPGGVGECCAPKLLNYAVCHHLRPVALAEFYWGGINKSGTKRSGEIYPCCETRCQPILGFMLCGLDDDG